MEPVERELLLRDAERFGYQLLQPIKGTSADVVRRMVSADDPRVLEGVPVVLTNILLREKDFALDSVESTLPSSLQKRFRILAAVTYLFLFWVPDSDRARKTLHQYVKDREPALIENVTDKLRQQKKLQIGNMFLDQERLEKTYKNYVVEQFMATQETLSQKLEEQRTAMFNEAVAELFTEKQRNLMFQLLGKQQLSKTDREYYSRAVKPRLKALRNPDLQTMAATLLGF